MSCTDIATSVPFLAATPFSADGRDFIIFLLDVAVLAALIWLSSRLTRNPIKIQLLLFTALAVAILGRLTLVGVIAFGPVALGYFLHKFGDFEAWPGLVIGIPAIWIPHLVALYWLHRGFGVAWVL